MFLSANLRGSNLHADFLFINQQEIAPFLILQNIQEEGDDSCIDQIGKHRTDDGDDEEGLDGIAVFIADSAHVGHRIGGCAKAEATHACTEDGSIVIAT